MTVRVRPRSEGFVAEIDGVDLTRPLGDDDLGTINKAFRDHPVLAFRGHRLTAAQHVAFSRHFGHLETHMLKKSLLDGHDKIFVLSNAAEDGAAKGGYNSGRFWHSDLSYRDRPSLGSLLYALEVPGEGIGDTQFADMYAAYEALSDKMKRRLDGLKAVHRYFSYSAYVAAGKERAVDLDRAAADRITAGELAADGVTSTPQATHPIVRTHPVTGRKALYVNEGLCIAVEGMPGDESRSLLNELFDHCTRAPFIYRHQWRPGDLVFWDNRCTQHRATPFDQPLRRLMNRTTIRGEKPL